MEFAVRCDIPLTWLDWAKENYPEDSQVVVNKVFYGWWDRCNLNLGKKLQMIQAAFGYIGKPAIFDRIVYTCPDLELLLDHGTFGCGCLNSSSESSAESSAGDGRTGTQKTCLGKCWNASPWKD